MNPFEVIKIIVLGIILIVILYVIAEKIMNHNDTSNREEEFVIIHSYFNIKNAMMCINCETVFSRQNNKQCPACGSESGYQLHLAVKSDIERQNTVMKGVIYQ
jgi:hypothetical protein